jgi:hypothetical protein
METSVVPRYTLRCSFRGPVSVRVFTPLGCGNPGEGASSVARRGSASARFGGESLGGGTFFRERNPPGHTLDWAEA